jgi:hypothetical protein
MHACVTYGGVESWYVREGKTAFNDRMSFSIYAGSLTRILCGPLLFLSGYFAHSSAVRRSPAGFSRTRVFRLGLPFPLSIPILQ